MDYYQVPTGLTLSSDEKVLWYDRRSWKSMIGLFILFGLTVWIFGLGFIFLIAAVMKRYGSEYALTNKRVYSRRGLISRHTGEAIFERITDTSLSQGVFGRLLNYGDVRTNTAGSYGYELVFRGVSDPKPLVGKIQNVRESSQMRIRKDERIERLRDEYYLGRITQEQFEQTLTKIKQEL